MISFTLSGAGHFVAQGCSQTTLTRLCPLLTTQLSRKNDNVKLNILTDYCESCFCALACYKYRLITSLLCLTRCAKKSKLLSFKKFKPIATFEIYSSLVWYLEVKTTQLYFDCHSRQALKSKPLLLSSEFKYGRLGSKSR